MSKNPIRSLPENPNLEFLKDQAKRLLKSCRKNDQASLDLLTAVHPKFRERSQGLESLALHDAQFVLARVHGFPSWNALKQEIARRNQASASEEELLVRAVWRGEAEELEARLAAGSRLSSGTVDNLRDALAGVVGRSVWHRPQYHRIAKVLVSHGVECSIWDAARVGLLEHVSKLLDSKPQLLNTANSDGSTPLQRAALIYGSHPECEATVAWLIAQGADVDVFTAAAYSMSHVVENAVRSQPSAIHQKVQGSTPLNWAVRPRHDQVWPAPLDTCALLIGAGSHLDSTDEGEHGMQPLHHIAEWGNREEMADLLVSRGADLNAEDDIGWTPLDYAIDRERTRLVTWLKGRGAKQTLVVWPNDFGPDGDLMMQAAKSGETETVKRLLVGNPSLARMRATNGATPLHWAAHNGHYEVASLLLGHTADVHAQESSCWGGTPLHWASEREPLLVELLLNHGADINSRNCRTQQTPLHYCARCDDVPEIAEMLLVRGACADACDHKKNTPLDYALRAGHAQVAGVLQARG